MRASTVRAALATAAVACLVVIGVQTAAAAGTPLTGETLTGTAVTSGTCTLTGTASYTFSSSGSATGAYPGAYTETGSFVLDTSNEATTSFTADFTITAVNGTVTGHLSGVINSPDGFCFNGATFAPPYGNAYANVGYTASISLPDGSACTDAGTANVRVEGSRSLTVEQFTPTGPFDCVDTPTGSNVLISPTDPATGLNPATVTFSSVTTAGNTSLTSSSTGLPAPSGFTFGSPPVYYYVTTSATFTTAVVCITDNSITAASRLFHFTNGVPPGVDVTAPAPPPNPDVVNHRICSSALTSLSPFAIGVASDTTPPTLTVPANATVEATGPAGAAFTYAATATDDVDLHPSVVCVPSSGSVFSLGATTVHCTATDAAGNSSSGSFTVTVVDTTPPSVTAALVPAAGADEGDGVFRVAWTCSDAVGVVSQSATLNGIAVQNGQLVKLQHSKKLRVKQKRGVLVIKAPAFTLVVTCRDAAGNTATASVSPVFPGQHDENDNDNDGPGGRVASLTGQE